MELSARDARRYLLTGKVYFMSQGMPFTLAVAANEYVSSSNMAWSLFPGITRGAIQALLVSGSDAQKETFIPPMVRGEWTGTMCLTEPHCGTDLGVFLLFT